MNELLEVSLITKTSSMMKVMPTIVNFYVKGPAAMDILIDLIGRNKFNAYTKAFMDAWPGSILLRMISFISSIKQKERNLIGFGMPGFSILVTLI